jgi:CRP/FNR family cyclic AMP-dependent transcriptional regulator
VLVPPGRDEDATALVDTRLTVVCREEHEELLRLPSVARAMTTRLIDALSDREDSLANFARFPHVERVRAKLLQLAYLHGKVVRTGVVIVIPLTHDLLAEMIGSARETVTRALGQLTRAGFVSREDGLYRLNMSAAEVAALSRSD